MARRKRSEVIDSTIKKVTQELFALKKACDDKAEELRKLEEEKKQIQISALLVAITKSGKSFEEVLNLINL